MLLPKRSVPVPFSFAGASMKVNASSLPLTSERISSWRSQLGVLINMVSSALD